LKNDLTVGYEEGYGDCYSKIKCAIMKSANKYDKATIEGLLNFFNDTMMLLYQFGVSVDNIKQDDEFDSITLLFIKQFGGM